MCMYMKWDKILDYILDFFLQMIDVKIPFETTMLWSLKFLRIVYSHIVIEDHEQEERDAQHVGEDCQLHICHHAVSNKIKT